MMDYIERINKARYLLNDEVIGKPIDEVILMLKTFKYSNYTLYLLLEALYYISNPYNEEEYFRIYQKYIHYRNIVLYEQEQNNGDAEDSSSSSSSSSSETNSVNENEDNKDEYEENTSSSDDEKPEMNEGIIYKAYTPPQSPIHLELWYKEQRKEYPTTLEPVNNDSELDDTEKHLEENE